MLVENLITCFKELTSIRIDMVDSFCHLAILCPKSLSLLKEIINDVNEVADYAHDLISKHGRNIEAKINELSVKILEEPSEEVIRKVNEIYDELSTYLLEPEAILSKLGIDTVLQKFHMLMKTFEECIERKVKNRDVKRKLKLLIRREFRKGLDIVITVVFLTDTFIYVTGYHALFEANISKLRYPDKTWSPLSISSKSLMVREAQRIINTLEKTELFKVLNEFITGSMESTKSRKIYESLRKVIESLSAK